MQTILHFQKVAYALTDARLKVVEVGGMLELFPMDRAESLQGLSLFAITPELSREQRDAIRALLHGHQTGPVSMVVERAHPRGGHFYLRVNNLVHRRDGQDERGVLHILQDVSIEERLRRALLHYQAENQELNGRTPGREIPGVNPREEFQALEEWKSKFMALTLHELRTPLASIIGYLDLFLAGEFGPLAQMQQEYLETVHRAAHRLLSITDNLADVSNLISARLTLQPQPTDLGRLISLVAGELQAHLNARGQELVIRVEPGLPAVLCDEARTVQILYNLLHNASKYSHEGDKIVLVVEWAAQPGFVQVSIADTGIGVPADEKHRLFESFFRAGNAYLSGESGFGLGLHIAKSLVDLQGGQLWFESTENVGSIFYFTLPVAP